MRRLKKMLVAAGIAFSLIGTLTVPASAAGTVSTDYIPERIVWTSHNGGAWGYVMVFTLPNCGGWTSVNVWNPITGGFNKVVWSGGGALFTYSPRQTGPFTVDIISPWCGYQGTTVWIANP